MDTDIDVEALLVAQLDGAVQSQGVRVGARAWIDIGSKEWDATPEQVRAAAYQAAGITGWSDGAIGDIVLSAFPFITPACWEYTLKLLQDLAKKYPVSVEKTKNE